MLPILVSCEVSFNFSFCFEQDDVNQLSITMFCGFNLIENSKLLRTCKSKKKKKNSSFILTFRVHETCSEKNCFSVYFAFNLFEKITLCENTTVRRKILMFAVMWSTLPRRAVRYFKKGWRLEVWQNGYSAIFTVVLESQ